MYLGGSAMASYFLMRELKPAMDPRDLIRTRQGSPPPLIPPRSRPLHNGSGSDRREKATRAPALMLVPMACLLPGVVGFPAPSSSTVLFSLSCWRIAYILTPGGRLVARRSAPDRRNGMAGKSHWNGWLGVVTI